MPTFQAEPANFADLLQIVRDGSEICLSLLRVQGTIRNQASYYNSRQWSK